MIAASIPKLIPTFEKGTIIKGKRQMLLNASSTERIERIISPREIDSFDENTWQVSLARDTNTSSNISNRGAGPNNFLVSLSTVIPNRPLTGTDPYQLPSR